MTKKENYYKYGIDLSITEYHNNESLTSQIIFNNFEMTQANNLLKILEKFNKNLKTYLVQHNLIENENSKLE